MLRTAGVTQLGKTGSNGSAELIYSGGSGVCLQESRHALAFKTRVSHY